MSNTHLNSEKMARASLAGAVVAALAASACCLLPAILAIVGLSGVGLAAALEPYRPIFLGGTVLLLAAGFYLTYRKPRAATTEGATADACGCEKPRVARSGKAMLWVASALAVGFAAYPYLAGAFVTKSTRGTAAPVESAATARIRVEGMTCESCVSHITGELAKLKGVIKAEVKYGDGLAIVTYDPAQVRPERLVEAISRIGYTAWLEV